MAAQKRGSGNITIAAHLAVHARMTGQAPPQQRRSSGDRDTPIAIGTKHRGRRVSLRRRLRGGDEIWHDEQKRVARTKRRRRTRRSGKRAGSARGGIIPASL